MKVLITGMDGFIGKDLSRQLSSSGWDVVGFSNGPEAGKLPGLYKGSVTNTEALREVFLRELPEACVHLAGLAHAVVRPEERETVRRVNVTGALNVAAAAADAGVQQFLFFSSAKVYGDTTPAAGFDEDDPPRPSGIYAELKYEAEQRLAEIAGKRGLGLVVVRPVAVLGPGDTKGNYARLIRAVKRGIFPLIGGGKAQRSIVYIKRVTERVDRILGSGFIPGRTYVFSDGTFELKEILRSMRRAAGPALLPYVPEHSAMFGGYCLDWVLRRTTGKPGNTRENLSRLTEHFVIRTHRYDSDFGALETFDLDRAIAETCMTTV